MKVKDIVNSQCDIRKYLSIDMSDEVKDEFETLGNYDVDSVLQAARIYVDADKLDEDVIPLALNDNQKIVLEWLKSNNYSLKLPMLAINQLDSTVDMKVKKAQWQLNREQEFEVLAAFAQWGSEQKDNENNKR
ncbi:hypothetical protein [Enterococcus hirae]|uniref:hypothetical protein n=1 Tax=Enterococcus hirae TaxID=1354 RepID=UPI001A9704DE|nr:hypothetical protein [Enterococcus hirae]MBO1103294.1 hypothetical protein [Enterococcus hirae]